MLLKVIYLNTNISKFLSGGSEEHPFAWGRIPDIPVFSFWTNLWQT